VVFGNAEQGPPAARGQTRACRPRQIPGLVNGPLSKRIWKWFERTRAGRCLQRVGAPTRAFRGPNVLFDCISFAKDIGK
jgi:hypothetical protein